MAADLENKDFTIKKFPLCSEGDFHVTTTIKDYFEKYGFVVVTGLLPSDELSKFKKLCELPEAAESMYNVVVKGFLDEKGEPMKLTLWKNLDDGYHGMISASEKVAGTWEALFEEEMYHYHSKMVMKAPETDGANVFNWHQDYGYWYLTGNLRPAMGTTWISIDTATKENGCLKIIPGSHKCGRIQHNMVDQVMADDERVQHIARHFGGWIYVELNPGDAVFFHSNILHRSEANTSAKRRWAFITAYNAAANDPPPHFDGACYSKLDKLPNQTLKLEAKLPTNCDFITSYAHDKSDKPSQK